MEAAQGRHAGKTSAPQCPIVLACMCHTRGCCAQQLARHCTPLPHGAPILLQLFSVGVLLLNALEAVRRGGRLLAEAVEGGSPVSPTVAAVLAACPPVEQAFVAARGGQGED